MAFLALLMAVLAMPFACGQARAHTGEGGFVLLLPTGYYLLGGTAAVAASFLLIALIPDGSLNRLAEARRLLCLLPSASWCAVLRHITLSLASLLLVLLLLIGALGNTDPLDNLLPLTIWTVWWVGFVVAQALFGNIWSWLNPWIVPAEILSKLARHAGKSANWRYPAWLGFWPASIAFFAFAWFELIYPAPADPSRLAWAAGLYSLWTILGIACFGKEAWLSRAEPFSIFFGLIARLSPFGVKEAGSTRSLHLAWPGAHLLEVEMVPVSGILFILLVLAAVTFDGLGSTFWWLGLGGINPLEFPGRSAVIGFMTLGLVATWLVLVVCYFLAIWLGARLADASAERSRTIAIAGLLVVSIMPISIAYHLAHYLTNFLVNIQDARVALSDPFARGWNLFGTADLHVSTAMLSNYGSVRLIWNIEAGVIVLGHILAVAVAHVAMRRIAGGRVTALPREVPLAALMILYTLFGLWLLATPHAG